MLKLIISMILLISPALLKAQETISVTVQSQALNELREVLIRLPKSYNRDAESTYPVLVILNDKDNFKWASDIVDVQSARYGVEELIVVGLPHAGDYTSDNYPYKDEDNAELSKQSQNYSAFIRNEALAHVDSNYRTNGARFIIGHSLSGLFVLQMFMQHSEFFSSYVALSPSMHYAPQMPPLLGSFLDNNKTLNKQLYVAIGENEHSLIQSGFQRLSESIKLNAQPKLTWEVVQFAHTDHMLSAYKGMVDGLAWIYKDWYIEESKMRRFTLKDYIKHYEQLSNTLQYSIKPREKHLIGFSGFAEAKLSDKQAARNAIEAAIHFNPKSQDLKTRLKELR